MISWQLLGNETTTAIYHENFLRGMPDMARDIEKPKKQKAAKGTSTDKKPYSQAQLKKDQPEGKKAAIVASPASAPSLISLKRMPPQAPPLAAPGVNGYFPKLWTHLWSGWNAAVCHNATASSRRRHYTTRCSGPSGFADGSSSGCTHHVPYINDG